MWCHRRMLTSLQQCTYRSCTIRSSGYDVHTVMQYICQRGLDATMTVPLGHIELDHAHKQHMNDYLGVHS